MIEAEPFVAGYEQGRQLAGGVNRLGAMPGTLRQTAQELGQDTGSDCLTHSCCAASGGRVLSAEIYRAWRTFEGYLRQGGYRVTLPRKLVLEHVFSRRDHFSADEAAAALHSGENRVSRATVYTTLDLLVRAGLVHKLQDNHDRAHYEAARGELQHEHMICDTCGKFLEFSNRALLAILAQECRNRGFRQRSQRIVVFGTCRECEQAAESGRKIGAS